jgi:anti-sigma B factor antagonist
MKIHSSTRNEVLLITLEGDVDSKSAPQVQQEVLPLIPDGGRMLLDLSAVPYMSSAGLRTLLLIYRQAQGRGSKVALSGLSEDISDTMSATGFLDYFVVTGDVPAGLLALA